MTKIFQRLIVTILIVTAFSSLAAAQQVKAEPVPVKVQIVFSRYEGDRKTSSLPYTMLISANGDRVQIQANANVPIPSSNGSYTYTNVGTSIDCTVTTEAGGRYKVALNLRDNLPIAPKNTASNANSKPPDTLTFGNFNYQGSISMKEGETKQIISSADRATGEVVKVDVTLNLDK